MTRFTMKFIECKQTGVVENEQLLDEINHGSQLQSLFNWQSGRGSLHHSYLYEHAIPRWAVRIGQVGEYD